MTVQLAGRAVNSTPGNDVLDPLKQLLIGLNVLPEPSDLTKASDPTAAVTGTPASVAILEAGGTALSKGWSALIGALGGLTAVSAAIKGFWGSETTAVRIALIAGAAFILAATAIAIGIIVASDVRGRAAGSVAQYNARSAVGVSFLQLSLAATRGMTSQDGAGPGNPPANPAAVPIVAGLDAASVTTMLAASRAAASVEHIPTGDAGHLSGIRYLNGGAEVRWTRTADAGTDWCVPSDLRVVEFTY